MRQAAGQQRRHPGDREAGGLGGQGRGAGGAGVDLDHHDPAALGVMGELDVGAADDLDRLDDRVGILLQLLLQGRGDRQHRRGAVAVAGVDAHRIDVLDEADGDHLVVGIAHDLQLQLFPAQHRFLHQHLVDQAGGQAAGDDDPQFLQIFDQAAAGAAHRVGRADDDRIAELGGDLLGVFEGRDGGAARHLDAEAVHGLLEGDAVLAALDGVDVDADDLDPVALKDPGAIQFGGEVEARLAAEVGEDGIGALGGDDLFQGLDVERLDIGDIGGGRIGHDRRRVGVDQHDLVAEGAQGLARLGAGIVELTGLADDDGAGTDDQNLMDVVTSGHGCSSGLKGYLASYGTGDRCRPGGGCGGIPAKPFPGK